MTVFPAVLPSQAAPRGDLQREELRQLLLDWRNRDGGWGYYPGKASRLEPTCWALLALGAGRSATPAASDVLGRWPRQDGLLLDTPGAPVNYAFNGLAALAYLRHSDGVKAAELILRPLTRAKGIRLAQSAAVRLDASLQAWPWIDATFSWVEPTAWCLLALKKHRRHGEIPDEAPRVREAERMLLDRACRSGGWNYGNSVVFGQELEPYVPTTALVLLAMQDRRDDPVVARGVRYLEAHATSEPSTVALALSLVCLRVFGLPGEGIEEGLIRQLPFSRSLGSVVGLAVSLYALTEAQHAMAAFKL